MASRQSVIRGQWLERIRSGEVITCALCGEPIPKKATGRHTIKNGGKGALTVDHIIPLSKGGSSRVENLQPVHLLCNQIKGDKDDEVARAEIMRASLHAQGYKRLP